MNLDNRIVIAWGFILITLILLFLIIAGLKKSLILTNDVKAKQQFQTIKMGVLSWLIIVSFLSLSGITTDFSEFPPKLILVLIPPLFFALYITFSGKADHILKVTPPHWLIIIQSFRIIVELFLYALFIILLIPEQMTFEGRNWDIIAGIMAIPVAYWILKSKNRRTLILLVFNFAGLILLFNIVSIAFLSAPTPVRMFFNEPANTIIGYFPFIFLPSILVPIAYTMHFLSLRQVFLIITNRINIS